MNTRPENVSLRPANASDREFLFGVYASTRAEEMSLVPWTDEQKAAFLRMQFEAQDSYYRQVYSTARFDVIERHGVPIGRLYVIRLDDEIRIIDIALLPEQRGRGLGTELLAGILNDADASGLPVSLHVEPWNPARRLYERLGFQTVEPGDIYERMERPARVASRQLKTAS